MAQKDITGEIINWKNPEFASQNGVGYSHNKKGDEIFAKFSSKGNEQVTLAQSYNTSQRSYYV